MGLVHCLVQLVSVITAMLLCHVYTSCVHSCSLFGATGLCHYCYAVMLCLYIMRSLLYRVGQNHIYTVCKRVYGIFGREFTIYTVIYGVYIRFWPTPLLYVVWCNWFVSLLSCCVNTSCVHTCTLSGATCLCHYCHAVSIHHAFTRVRCVEQLVCVITVMPCQYIMRSHVYAVWCNWFVSLLSCRVNTSCVHTCTLCGATVLCHYCHAVSIHHAFTSVHCLVQLVCVITVMPYLYIMRSHLFTVWCKWFVSLLSCHVYTSCVHTCTLCGPTGLCHYCYVVMPCLHIMRSHV